jgi:hypothetical protein
MMVMQVKEESRQRDQNRVACGATRAGPAASFVGRWAIGGWATSYERERERERERGRHGQQTQPVVEGRTS